MAVRTWLELLAGQGDLQLKVEGYELARRMAQSLPVRQGLTPGFVGLDSKPSTQEDIESEWAATWCSALQIPQVYHRKIWELAYALQAMHDAGVIGPDKRGLGFGCGREVIASYLASQGNQVTVTDLPDNDRRRVWWARTRQHAGARDDAFHEHLVDYQTFDRRVAFRHVDMNHIPPDLTGFDFCWSICALEHLGNIKLGMAFVENAMATLRPGGVAIHTTEFNYRNNDRTIEKGYTVLFQRRHFEDLAARLTQAGHSVAPLNFDVGAKPMDEFVDTPPYPHNYSRRLRQRLGLDSFHLKLMVGRYASTCFGLIVTKGDG